MIKRNVNLPWIVFKTIRIETTSLKLSCSTS